MELPFATGAPTRRARAAAQMMFLDARAFNQPVAAWDVGQVTSMGVRRRARVGSVRGWGGSPGRGPLRPDSFATGASTQRTRAVVRRRACSMVRMP